MLPSGAVPKPSVPGRRFFKLMVYSCSVVVAMNDIFGIEERFGKFIIDKSDLLWRIYLHEI
jgi:hypothetical protein